VRAGCCSRLCRELDWENVDLDSTTTTGTIHWTSAFGHVSNTCLRTWKSFFIFRAANAFIMTSVLVASMIDTHNKTGFEYWWVWLTHWTLLFQVAYLILAVACTWNLRTDGVELAHQPVRLIQALWLLQGIVVPATFLVTVMYWLLVFDWTDPKLRVISFLTHGLNFAIQLSDLLVSAQPYLFMHGVYFLLFAISYLIFSIVHYCSGIGSGDGRKYIYKSLDWGSPGSASFTGAIVLILISPLVNLLFWWIVQKIKYRALGHGINGTERTVTTLHQSEDELRGTEAELDC